MFDFYGVLIAFLLAHVVCDFYLQPKRWVDAKKAYTYRAPALYFHSLLHGVAFFVTAVLLGVDLYTSFSLLIIALVSHFFIDWWKAATPNGEAFSYFVIDQVLHIFVVVLITIYVVDGVTINIMLHHEKVSHFVMVIFAYLLILKPTSITITGVLKKYPVSGDASNDVNGLIAGGELIGYLERVLILTFTLVGSYAAVGFVLAAKSIFRFGELNKSQDRGMTEYVLIGSLLSVVITTVIGALVSLGLDIQIK